MARQKNDQLITAKQVAEMAGLSERTIYAGKAGTESLVRIKVGKRGVRWSQRDVQEWIRERIKAAREAERLHARSRGKVLPFRISGVEINRIIAGVRNESTECKDQEHISQPSISVMPGVESSGKALSEQAGAARPSRERDTAKITGSALGGGGNLTILRSRKG